MHVALLLISSAAFAAENEFADKIGNIEVFTVQTSEVSGDQAELESSKICEFEAIVDGVFFSSTDDVIAKCKILSVLPKN